MIGKSNDSLGVFCYNGNRLSIIDKESSVSNDLNAIAADIQLLVLDVDGVLTDGAIILTNEKVECKNFNVKDGLGIKLLQQAGIQVAVITGKRSELVAKRLADLGIEHVYQGQKNKHNAFVDLQEKTGICPQNIAYMGDDLPDLVVMRQVALASCPADAVMAVQDRCDWVSTYHGGHGAVRQLCDWLISQQQSVDYIEQFETKGQADFSCGLASDQ